LVGGVGFRDDDDFLKSDELLLLFMLFPLMLPLLILLVPALLSDEK
jgi:hypothetical protein